MQDLPVRIFQNKNQFGLITPLAGLEPADIRITIDGKRVTIEGKQRGPGQDRLDLLQTEWSIGPYHRELEFPEELDGSLANATYGNGVLVLTIPKANSVRNPTRAQFTLEPIHQNHGERVGHTGRNLQPTTTSEHEARVSEMQKKPAA